MEQEEKATWLLSPTILDWAPIRFGIMSSRTYPDPKPAIIVGDRVLNLGLLKKWDGFSLLKSIQPHLDVFDEPDLNAYAALPSEVRSEVRQYLQDMLIRDGPHAAALQDKLLIRAAVVFPVADVVLHYPFKAHWLDAGVL
ncbi:hypothetical protein RBB50_008591 [Rhinocladiella similis]